MTVGELIALLQKHPMTRRVVISDEDGGCHDLDTVDIEEVELALNSNAGHWPGHHDIINSSLMPDDREPDEIAVCI